MGEKVKNVAENIRYHCQKFSQYDGRMPRIFLPQNTFCEENRFLLLKLAASMSY